MAEYKRQTILTMVMAGVVGISLIVGVLFLPTASNAPTATAGACAIPFPSISEFFPNPNDTQTTFANGTVLDRAWMEVLLMPANSSGQLCVLYSHFPNYPAKSYTIQPLIQHVRVSLMQTSATLPTISAYPSNFTLIDNENASVAFSVQAPQGSSGIYSLYIPGILPPPCIPPPLVVGYSLSEVNSTDFTAWTNPTSCPPGFDATAFYVGLTNMQVGFVPYYYTPSNTST